MGARAQDRRLAAHHQARQRGPGHQEQGPATGRLADRGAAPREGIAGLKEGLELMRTLIEGFWDSLYPEIEDGDAEFRATPLEWVGDRLDQAIKRAALTRNGLDWFQYKESRTVGYEDRRDHRGQARRARGGHRRRQGHRRGLRRRLRRHAEGVLRQRSKRTWTRRSNRSNALGQLCDEKFGDVSPSFGKLRDTRKRCGRPSTSCCRRSARRSPTSRRSGAGAGYEDAAAEPAAEA